MKEKEIPYQFTAMPVNLTACMDNHCRSMLFTLLQLSSYYADEDGWFYRTSMDLQMQSRLSDKLVTEVISKFHRIGILDVQSVGQANGKFPNRFRLNQEKFLQWENQRLEDCVKNPNLYIEKEDRKQKGWKPSYLTPKSNSSDDANASLNVSRNPHNIENADNVDNVDNTENAHNTENAEKKKENVDIHQGTLGETDMKQSQDDAFDRYYREEDMYMRILNSYPHNWRGWEDILIALDVLMEKAPSPDLAEQTYWKIRCFLNERVTCLREEYAEDPYCDDAIDFENKLEEWASYSKGQSGAFSYFGDD